MRRERRREASAPECRARRVCPRRTRKEGTASMSNDSEMSANCSASMFKKRTEGNWAASCSTALLKATHGSAQGAQKLRHETLLRSAERSSLKCSGELTWTRLLADIVVGRRKLGVDNTCT